MTAPFDKDHYNPLETFAFEQIAIADTAGGIALTATKYDPSGGNGPAKMATIQVESQPVRMVIDGATVSSTVGELLAAGDRVIIWGTMDIKTVRFIRSGGTNAQLNVHYAR